MRHPEAPPVIPLWIDGHAFLTVTPTFQEVRHSQSGVLLRRVPLCGVETAQAAIAAARAALPVWRATPEALRVARLHALGDALAPFAAHFAALVYEEAGGTPADADAEIAAAVAVLQQAESGRIDGVVAVITSPGQVLLPVLRTLVPALAGGATVVLRPHPDTPSALLALAELSGRCGFPAGVFNVVHGGIPLVDALRASPEVHLLAT